MKQRGFSLAILAAGLTIGIMTGWAAAGPLAAPSGGCVHPMTCYDVLRIWWQRWKAHLDASPGDIPAPLCSRANKVPGVACYAQPSDTGRYEGGWVGGGAARGGGPPGPEEGTWGWDYWGQHWWHRFHVRRYPFLNWARDGRYQGGTGAYKTDGPRFPPNIIIFSEKAGEQGHGESGHETGHGGSHKGGEHQ
jgi:hypothetical protein